MTTLKCIPDSIKLCDTPCDTSPKMGRSWYKLLGYSDACSCAYIAKYESENKEKNITTNIIDYDAEYRKLNQEQIDLILEKFYEEQEKRDEEIKLDTIKNAEKMIAKFIKKKDRKNIRAYIDECSEFDIDDFNAGECIPLRLYDVISFGKQKAPTHNIVIYVSSDIERLDSWNITQYDFIQTLIDGFMKCNKKSYKQN